MEPCVDIYQAIDTNNIEAVKLWLNDYENWRLFNVPFNFAIRKGNLEILKLLIEKTGRINSYSSRARETPLICAINNNELEIVQYLLSVKSIYKLNIHSTGYTDNTPLHCAIQNANELFVSLLLQNGADVHSTTKYRRYTPLHDAAWLGNLNICTMLLSHGADVNSTNKYDTSPLYNAAKNGNLDVCVFLIEKKANLDNQSNVGSTALHEAVMKGHHDICKLLVNSGANIHLKNRNGFTPLHQAVMHGHLNICKLLVEAKADINCICNDYTSPLLSATFRENFEICSYLLSQGANVNKANNKQFTPLHAACLSGRYDLCELMINNGANINALNEYYETPLLVAVKQSDSSLYTNPVHISFINNNNNNNNYNLEIDVAGLPAIPLPNDSDEILKLLLDNGANINAVDADYNSVAHIVAEINDLKKLEIFFQYKININLKNYFNMTAFDIARVNENDKMVDEIFAYGLSNL